MAQRFYSTKSPGNFVDVKEAVLRSLPADNGLYMPEVIEPLGDDFWKSWREMSLGDLGFQIRHAHRGRHPRLDRSRRLASRHPAALKMETGPVHPDGRRHPICHLRHAAVRGQMRHHATEPDPRRDGRRL